MALRLTVEDASLPDGRTVSFVVEPGEIIALAGPNGSGKSTLLARIGGQLHDAGRIRLDGREEDGPPPRVARGVVGRARRGVARTWQRPPEIDPADGLMVATGDPAGPVAAAWAAATLGDEAATMAGQDLVRLAARRPGLALLDEPAAHLPADRVVAFVRGLAAAGTTVVVAEHRPEILRAVDRVVDLERPDERPDERRDDRGRP